MRAIFPLGLGLILVLMASCMKDKPESIPKNLVWNPELAIPLGIDRFGMNAESGFDTTLFELDTLTNLPKWVDEVEVVMLGRVEFDLANLEESIENINQVLFRVSLYNGFPNELWAQAYFLDAFSNPIDSMFAEGAIHVPAGRPIGNGSTIDPKVVRKDAIFENERLALLQDATEILLRASFPEPSPDTALIPFYPDYFIDMEIGIMADLSLQF